MSDQIVWFWNRRISDSFMWIYHLPRSLPNICLIIYSLIILAYMFSMLTKSFLLKCNFFIFGYLYVIESSWLWNKLIHNLFFFRRLLCSAISKIKLIFIIIPLPRISIEDLNFFSLVAHKSYCLSTDTMVFLRHVNFTQQIYM